MGLDVTAFERVELVQPCSTSALSPDDWDEMYDNDQVYLYNLPEFAARGDGLPDGVYQPSGRTLRWAGAYSSYGRFRDAVSRGAIGVPAATVWADYERYADRPFAPLIHFADNEGFLGPKTCARLAEDAGGFGGFDLGGWTPAWEMWVSMFHLVAGTGVLRFH